MNRQERINYRKQNNLTVPQFRDQVKRQRAGATGSQLRIGDMPRAQMSITANQNQLSNYESSFDQFLQMLANRQSFSQRAANAGIGTGGFLSNIGFALGGAMNQIPQTMIPPPRNIK